MGLFVFDSTHTLAPAQLFGSGGAMTMFASLMVSTGTVIVAGIPAALYERFTGAREDSTGTSLWIWLAATALMVLPAGGNERFEPLGTGFAS